MIIAKKAAIQGGAITAKASAVTPTGTGSSPAISVDSALSSTSTNPVQNRVITAAVNDMSSRIASVESQALSGAPTPVSTVAEMTDTSKAYLYTGSESGYISGNWYYWNGSAWASGGTFGGLANGSVTGKKLSASIRTALKQIFQHVAYADEQGQMYYTALVTALDGGAVVTSLSAVYTQSGTVYDTDSLDDLKADLVVTVNYSDGTSEVVADYELSGGLTEGTSVITVEYEDATTTFNVTVTAVVYLYKDGDECTALTGGYSKKGFIANDSRITYSNDGTCLNFVLSATASTNTAGTLTSANKIDLTNYSAICFEIDSYRSKTDANMWCYLSDTVTNATTNAAFGSPFNRIFMSTDATGKHIMEYSLDDITGERFISFLINAWNSLTANNCYLKVYKAYLKPKVNA